MKPTQKLTPEEHADIKASLPLPELVKEIFNTVVDQSKIRGQAPNSIIYDDYSIIERLIEE